MTQLTQPRNSPRRKSDPPWLWVVLMAGSVAVHAGLLALSLPSLSRVAERPTQAASVPVDFVELPAEANSIALPDQAAEQTNPLVDNATESADTASDNVPAPEATSLTTPDPNAIGFAPEVPVGFNTPVLPPQAPATPDPPPEAPFTEPFTEPDAQITNPEAPNSPEIDPLPDSVGAIPSLPAASPTPPGFSTIPIDIPVPDVSETLPLPSTEVDPATLGQADINQTAPPVRLVASLSLERIPATEAGDDPEELASPVDGVVTQEIADPRISPCFSAIQPVALQSLGTSVGLQVNTNSTGVITQTTLRESSQNAAYDELAQCLVQQWQFNPAITNGEPVASNALLIRITIESDTTEREQP